MRTRILTALVLVPLTIAALFLLPPRAWGAVTLMVILAATREWALLSGYRARAAWVFVAAMLIFGGATLFAPGSGFDAVGGWPPLLVVTICGAATLFWVAVAP